MLGATFAVLSAATFGFNNAAIRRGVLSGSVLQALSITVPMGVPFIFVILLLTGQLNFLFGMSNGAYILFAIAGIVHFVWGRYCNYRSTKAMGGNLAGPWAQLNVVLSLVLAIIFLGETLSVMALLGIGLIMVGVAATAQAGRVQKRKAKLDAEKPDHMPSSFQPNYVEGYTFAILTATGHGVSPVLVALALEGLTPSHSIAGALISYAAAALTVLIIILISRNWQHVCSVNRSSLKWFTLGGILVGTSQTLRYAALSLAPVSVVMPIQSTSALFRIIFAWFINREHEIFGFWILIGVLLTIVGVTTLAVGADLLGILQANPAVQEILSHEWFGR